MKDKGTDEEITDEELQMKRSQMMSHRWRDHRWRVTDEDGMKDSQKSWFQDIWHWQLKWK
jgi:hypothetical protein